MINFSYFEFELFFIVPEIYNLTVTVRKTQEIPGSMINERTLFPLNVVFIVCRNMTYHYKGYWNICFAFIEKVHAMEFCSQALEFFMLCNFRSVR